MAEAFAAEGHNLFLTARNEVRLYNALESLQSRFPDQVIKAKPFDLASKQGALDFGNWILDLKLVPDILINNAGSFEPGSIYNEPDGQLETMLQTNFLSAYHITRLLLPHDETQIGSYFQYQFHCRPAGLSNRGSYSISKYALTGFQKPARGIETIFD
jgi:short-subunit dehydrogenase